MIKPQTLGNGRLVTFNTAAYAVEQNPPDIPAPSEPSISTSGEQITFQLLTIVERGMCCMTKDNIGNGFYF